jgi:hypothetical protein
VRHEPLRQPRQSAEVLCQAERCLAYFSGLVDVYKVQGEKD